MSNETALQRLIDDEQAENLVDDLKELLEADPEEPRKWELAFEFTVEDIPALIEELETDGGK